MKTSAGLEIVQAEPVQKQTIFQEPRESAEIKPIEDKKATTNESIKGMPKDA